MSPLDLIRLTALMEFARGRAEMTVGLIDGPVAVNHPDLMGANIREVPGPHNGSCALTSSMACMHGTLVAGVLLAKRDSPAPAICPDCTLLVRPVFVETTNEQMPSSTPEELGEAIIDCIHAGARLLNLSAALVRPSARGERELGEALDYAARRGVIIVAAAGNQGTVGSSAITRHPWVIPVIACDLAGRPMRQSNLGNSIGRHGLSAPGDAITSLGLEGKSPTFGGTSAAAPFVAGAIALLWSEFPAVSAAQVRTAVTHVPGTRRATVVPPLLDAWAAYQALAMTYGAR